MHNKTPDNRKLLGRAGELIAVSFLKQKGYKIVERNYSSKYGEIDLIALDDGYLVFIEVKLRKEGLPAAYSSVSATKKKKLIRTALFFLQENRLYDNHISRFDVIAVVENKNSKDYRVEHLENAFSTDEVDYQLWTD